MKDAQRQLADVDKAIGSLLPADDPTLVEGERTLMTYLADSCLRRELGAETFIGLANMLGLADRLPVEHRPVERKVRLRGGGVKVVSA